MYIANELSLSSIDVNSYTLVINHFINISQVIIYIEMTK